MKLLKLKPVSGVYTITNVKNGKVYIGQSINIKMRWSAHVDALFYGKHTNKSLLSDFQDMGIKVFNAEIVELCEPDKVVLLKRERFYIAQYYQGGYDLYNTLEDSFGFTFPFVKHSGRKWI